MPVPHTGSFKSGIEGGGGSLDMFLTPTTQEPLAKSKTRRSTQDFSLINPQVKHQICTS